MKRIPIIIGQDGRIRAVYDDAVDLRALGDADIRRASHVEPVGIHWQVDLTPVGGPILRSDPRTGQPIRLRSRALEIELDWLREQRLPPVRGWP